MSDQEKIRDIVYSMNNVRYKLEEVYGLRVYKNLELAIKKSKDEGFKNAVSELAERFKPFSEIKLAKFEFNISLKNPEKIIELIKEIKSETTIGLKESVQIMETCRGELSKSAKYFPVEFQKLNETTDLTKMWDLVIQIRDKKDVRVKNTCDAFLGGINQYRFYELLRQILDRPETEYVIIMKLFIKHRRETIDYLRVLSPKAKKRAQKINDTIETLITLLPDYINLAP